MRRKRLYKPKISSDGRFLLNLGCGDRFHSDWNNLDIKPYNKSVVRFDIKNGVPYQENSFDAIYACHFFEHFNREKAIYILDECHRVLRSGGIIRIVIPNLEYDARLYLESLQDVLREDSDINKEHYEWALLNLIDQFVRRQPGGETLNFWEKRLLDPAFIFNTTGGGIFKTFWKYQNRPKPSIKEALMRWLTPSIAEMLFRNSGEVHHWAYDSYSLKKILGNKFNQVTFLNANTSKIANFAVFNLDVDGDGTIHKPNSLFVEAIK